MSGDTPRLRLSLIAVVAVSLFVALFARLWFLQVLTAGEHELAAQRNQRRAIPLPATRGRILDRNGEVLVTNRASNVVTVDRSRLRPLDQDEQETLIRRLAAVVDRPPSMLRERLDDQRLGPFAPVPVAEDVDESVLVELRERRSEFPGVEAEQTAVRAYPHGSLAAHVLGYVGAINAEELATLGSPYRPGSRIGKDGVEKTFEADLRGVDGEVVIEVDAENLPVREITRRPPVQGNDIVLSIDLEVQRVTEAALAQGMERVRPRIEDNGQPVLGGGSAVALDVDEGTVVAMASWPTFSPAEFVYGISPRLFADLNDPARGTPFVNRAVLGTYSPGSTWKLVTAMAGLATGVITPETVFVDQGVYTIPNCGRGCSRQNAGRASYGEVALSRALTVSSDVYFYDIGAKLWQQREQVGPTPMQDMGTQLGFGTGTGVALPVEADGRIPTPERRAQLNQQNPAAFPNGDWFIGDNVNLSIGQGELAVTPIQLANAYATFATGGTRYAPNVVLRVQTPDGEVVREVPPRVAAEVQVPPEARAPIMNGLVGVTAGPDPRATAVKPFAGFPLDVYPVAGKTGTAQTGGDRRDNALFAAIAPAHDPRYALTVVMERAGFGATAAAPVARRMLGQLSGLEEPAPVTFVTGGRE